jgi:hypothetical protein
MCVSTIKRALLSCYVCRLLELLYVSIPDKQLLDTVVAALPGKHGNIVKLATADARELTHTFAGNEVKHSS